MKNGSTFPYPNNGASTNPTAYKPFVGYTSAFAYNAFPPTIDITTLQSTGYTYNQTQTYTDLGNSSRPFPV